MRENLEDKDVNLIIRTVKTHISDHNGEMLYGWIYYEDIDESKEKELIEIEDKVKLQFEKYPNLFAINIHKNFSGEEVNVLIEAVGTEPITPQEVLEFEAELFEEMDRKINLDVWYKSDAVITRDGYRSFEDYNEVNIYRLEKKLRQEGDSNFGGEE